MGFYLLIVDDEVQIRRGIEQGIPWSDHGVTRVFTAEDPVEGLTLLREQKIHILITDIRMPGMTGLEFAKKAKEVQEEIRVILLSGYSEFEYAREAINIGVVEYLLKPIKVKEPTGLVDRIAGEIREEESEKKEERRRMQARELELWLVSGDGGEELIRTLAEFTNAGPREIVLCVVLGLDTSFLHQICSQEEQVLDWLLSRKKGFVLKKGRVFAWCFVMDMLHSRDQVMLEVQKALSEENTRRREKGLYTLSAAAGRLDKLESLPRLVKETEALLHFRLCRGRAIWVDGTLESNADIQEAVLSLEQLQELRRYVSGYCLEKAEAFIQTLFVHMQQKEITSYSLVRGICINLMQILVDTLSTMGMDESRLLGVKENYIREIPEFLLLGQYQQWIQEQYRELLHLSKGLNREGISNVILSALVYIDGHYQEEITVDILSTRVRKSRNYFSTLFKQEMGMPFTEYLNRYRVEQAKKLLEVSVDLSGEIAGKVGFRDEKYFSAVFKKIEGCTPTEYRRKKGLQ